MIGIAIYLINSMITPKIFISALDLRTHLPVLQQKLQCKNVCWVKFLDDVF